MFNLLNNLVSSAIRTINNVLNPPKPPAPKPAPLPRYIPPVPAPSFAPIATWGESASSIQQRTTQWRASPAYQAQTTWQAQQRAEAAARAAAAEAARRAEEERQRREAARRAKQAQVDGAIGASRNLLTGLAKQATSWLSRTLGTTTPATVKPGTKKSPHEGFESQAEADSFWKWYAAQTPERQREVDDYNRIKNSFSARAKAAAENSQKKPGTGFMAQVFDTLTLGDTRRAIGARAFADERANDINRFVSEYEKRQKSFLAEQAKRAAAVEAAKLKGWDAYNKALEEYSSWEAPELKKLNRTAAGIEGLSDGFSRKSREEISTRPARALSWLNSTVGQSAPVKAVGSLFNYTLGAGDQNIPSLVTAPSRVINFFNNLRDPNGTKNFHGGVVTQGLPTGTNPWTATYNQRNLNFAQPTKVEKDKFLQTLYQQLGAGQSGQTFLSWYGKHGKELDKLYADADRQSRESNYAVEFLADPLSALSGGAKLAGSAARSSKFLTSLSKSRPANFLRGVADSGPVKKLFSEHKTRSQELADAKAAQSRASREAADKFLPKFIAAREQGALQRTTDYSVLDDLKRLSDGGDDSAAAVLQRISKGKLAARDRIKFYSAFGKNPRETEITKIADKWMTFSENMRKVDKVENTRFGRDKKIYFPRVDYSGEHTLDTYNFRAFKKRSRHTQSASELYGNAVDRLFKSDLSELTHGAPVASKAELDTVLKQYHDYTRPSKVATIEAMRRTKTPYGRVEGALTRFGPTALWKKAVLKYRPAWYVNNFLYNTQATALSAGAEGVLNQFRFMRPKNLRAAKASIPQDVVADVGSMTGGRGKLDRFGSDLENISRFGAYKALIDRGMTHEQALSRVNKYLYDYKTRNIERPLRAVVPFYSFQKSAAKAAVQMPLDRPIAAKAYNGLDREQREAFDREFDKVVPRLQALGYTEEQIEQVRAEQAKLFGGRLKVGDSFLNTPFNVFSKSGLSQMGLNPYLAASIETVTGKDSWRRQLEGGDSTFLSRLGSKFPGLDLARSSNLFFDTRRAESWIGREGSEGYGMAKQAQGFDVTQPSYRADLDPSRRFTTDFLAYLGVPRTSKFDAEKLIERKTMEKVKADYFATDWKSMNFPAQEAKRNELFAKYGITADKFYKGELAKYDTQATKQVKAMKEDAFKKTKALFAEYGAQPHGTRSVWATAKLKELVETGYFNDNPFLKSFDWLNPDTIARAHKKIAYDYAKSTGNWSAYNAAFGKSAGVAKREAWQKAKSTGDWTAYRQQYGGKSSPYQADGRFFKSAESMARYQRAQFWQRYDAADRATRRQMLADNPQYNERAFWTAADWTKWRDERKRAQKERAKSMPTFAKLYAQHLTANRTKAAPVTFRESLRGNVKLVFTN